MTRAEYLEQQIHHAATLLTLGDDPQAVRDILQDALDVRIEETPLEQALARAQKAEERLAAIIAHWRRLADAMDVAMLAKGAQR